jgi:hypothetical protein
MNLELLMAQFPHLKLRPGKCLIELERKPELDGSIILPEKARDLRERDIAYFGTVLDMQPRRLKDGRECPEQFKAGDRVWVMLLQCDLGERVILTENTRVYAVAV